MSNKGQQETKGHDPYEHLKSYAHKPDCMADAQTLCMCRDRCDTCRDEVDLLRRHWVVRENDKERYRCERCHALITLLEYRKTRIITSSLWLDATLAVHRTPRVASGQWQQAPVDETRTLATPEDIEIVDSMECVSRVLKQEYEPKVWFGGLQAFLKTESAAQHSATFVIRGREVTLLSLVSAGRAMQTIRSGDDWVTVICDETSKEPRSGIQGLRCVATAAVELLRAATEAWQKGVVSLAPDKSVFFG